jgi:hypothetical protein
LNVEIKAKTAIENLVFYLLENQHQGAAGPSLQAAARPGAKAINPYFRACSAS